jgi:hypothetical protein
MPQTRLTTAAEDVRRAGDAERRRLETTVTALEHKLKVASAAADAAVTDRSSVWLPSTDTGVHVPTARRNSKSPGPYTAAPPTVPSSRGFARTDAVDTLRMAHYDSTRAPGAGLPAADRSLVIVRLNALESENVRVPSCVAVVYFEAPCPSCSCR